MPDADDELARLRAADPVDPATVPLATGPDAHALFERITMTDTPSYTDGPQPPRRRAAVLAATALLVVAGITAAAVIAAARGHDHTDTAGPGTSVTSLPGGSASCVEPYEGPGSLAHRETVFDGTVTSVEGDEIAFSVKHWYKGGDSAKTTLRGASTLGAVTSTGPPLDLTPGTRLLVAGDGGFAWACGYTQPYDSAVGRQWADAVAEAVGDGIGACRSRTARDEAAGKAIVEWVPLSADLPVELDAVFTATGIEDRGDRDIYSGKEGDGVDLPKLARFSGTRTLAGTTPTPTEALLSPYQLADAQAEVATGAKLLVWIRARQEDQTFASLAALEPDGDAVFLGDCIPAWTPAFARYAGRAPMGRTAADLLTKILVEPDSPEATSFRASDTANTLAGPGS